MSEFRASSDRRPMLTGDREEWEIERRKQRGRWANGDLTLERRDRRSAGSRNEREFDQRREGDRAEGKWRLTTETTGDVRDLRAARRGRRSAEARGSLTREEREFDQRREEDRAEGKQRLTTETTGDVGDLRAARRGRRSAEGRGRSSRRRWRSTSEQRGEGDRDEDQQRGEGDRDEDELRGEMSGKMREHRADSEERQNGQNTWVDVGLVITVDMGLIVTVRICFSPIQDFTKHWILLFNPAFNPNPRQIQRSKHSVIV